ncbi:MAG: hypothetical protein IKK24_06660, partial [Clostridia bacterium]|nr:hypothetical protein [Clostridia bacterium]
EGQANDRTGGTGSKVYDLEQVGVIDYVNKYHWSDDYLNSLPESQRNDNWLITVHNPPNWWLSGASGSDIVTTTKNGKYYAASSRYQNWGLSGTNQYYTYTVSSHDYPSGEGDNVLAYGYSAIFAPVIPVWMAGDEAGSIFGLGTGNSLYFNAMVNTDLPAASGQAEFYKKIKKYIEIRRTYSDIFSFFPSNHRNTNICAVNVSGISTYQAYARYANGKAVIIVPNGTENDADITVTIPVSAAGIDSGYTVTDLLSNKSLNASKDKFTVSVAAGDMAVILVDDGTATTGSETTVAANKAARVALRNSAVGAVEALIKAISPVTVNSATAIERAEKAYNALSDSEKLKVKGYYDLLKAREQYNAVIANGNDSKYAGILKDGDMYPNSSTYIKWGWSNTMDELGETGDGGYNFNYNYTADGAGNKSGWNKEYRFEIMRPVSLNGATAQFTVNPEGSYYEKIFFLKISPKHMDMTENGNIGIKFDMAGGQVFFRVNNTACDHSSMVGYNASYPDRIFKALGNTVALSFNYADDGGLIININGTDFKISADDFNKAYGVKSAEQVLFYVSPCDSSYPDVTIDYLNTGTKKVTKSCDEYKIKIADMLPAFEGGYASWVNYINRSDSSAGLKIEYLNVLNTDFRLWTKNAYNLDGLHLKLTYNGNEYNDRMFMLSFTNSSNNTDKGLHIKIDSMGQQMYVGLENKGWINTTGLPTTMGGYPDRVFDPAFNRDTIELLITKQKDGGFIINVNGYKFPVTKDQIKSIPSLTDTKCVYVGISSIGSSPDLTVNYLHSGEDLCYSCEKGDVNCDHFINILDFIKLKKNISDGIDIYSADLDGDGIGDSEDLAIIRKMLLGVKI